MALVATMRTRIRVRVRIDRMPGHEQPPRRTGDAIAIDGGYQHRALTEGPAVQRFWHRSKLLLLDWMLHVGPGDRVLDVGFGSGVFADAMAARGAQVLGVDANPAAVAYAQRTFGRPGLEFRLGLLDELRLPDESVDKAVCLEIVEHVYLDQVRELLQSLRAVLVAGGQVLITTPNYRGLWPIVEWALDRFSGAATMDAEQHVTHFNRRLLRQVCEDAGFEVRALRTYSTFAPFAAGVSTSLAERLERVERLVDLPFGNLLVGVLRKP
jgi:2-polyprenyl-3-methyl-5-hydroxy-6-metoxy-1,4-benzoquinol methylase